MTETLEEMRARHKREKEEAEQRLNGEMRVAKVALFTVVLLIIAGGPLIAWSECSAIGEETGRRTSYSLHAGCFVEVGGDMVPLDAWRVAGD